MLCNTIVLWQVRYSYASRDMSGSATFGGPSWSAAWADWAEASVSVRVLVLV